MPTRPPTLRPGKPTPAPSDARPSPSRRGYGRDWRRVRLAVLAERPLCEDCGNRGVHVPATDVDHVTALARGGTHHPDNLRALCHACHSRKTVAVDGGLGRPRG